MPFRVLFILFALLFGACDDTISGSVRQVDYTTPTILNSTDTFEGDVSYVDTIDLDTSVPDIYVEDTGETFEVGETDVTTETTLPDTTPETVEEVEAPDTVDTLDTTVTFDTLDTTPEIEVTLPECNDDFDCEAWDELCFDGTCRTASQICAESLEDQAYQTYGFCCVKQQVVEVEEGICSESMVTDEIVFYWCVEEGEDLVIEEVSCNDHNDDTIDICDQSYGCENWEIDSDDDGFYNSEDDCPFEAEVYDLYDDWDGCPEDDQDHDGSIPPEDCDDDSTIDGPLATYCEDEFGFYVMINTYVNDPLYPDCLEGSSVIFLTDGSFFNGGHIDGQDYPGDSFDNDCDGETDEAGESGLIDCWWYEIGEFVSMVECPWMTEELAD